MDSGVSIRKTLVCLLVCLLLTASFAHAEDSVVEDVETEFEPKTEEQYATDGITIVLPTDWKPFSFLNEKGERTGYLVEIWNAWIAHSKIPSQILYAESSDGLESLKNKEVDVLGGLRHESALNEVIDFSGSLHSTTTILAIRDDSSVDCSNALYEVGVGVVDGSRAHAAFGGKYPQSTAIPFPDAHSAAISLLDGTIEAVAVEYTPLIKVARERGEADGLTICRTVHYDEIYAGIQKDEEHLLALVNDGFEAIPADEWAQIKGRWFEKQEARKLDWTGEIVPVAAAFIFVLLAVYLWLKRRR